MGDADEKRYREALERIGSVHGLECGCGMPIKECDAMPCDEPPWSSYFCGGRIARRALASPVDLGGPIPPPPITLPACGMCLGTKTALFGTGCGVDPCPSCQGRRP